MSSAGGLGSEAKKKKEPDRVKKATETFSIYEPKLGKLKSKTFKSLGQCSFDALQGGEGTQKLYYPSHYVHTQGINLDEAEDITEKITESNRIFPVDVSARYETLEIIRPFYLDADNKPWYPSLPPPVPPVQVLKVKK